MSQNSTKQTKLSFASKKRKIGEISGGAEEKTSPAKRMKTEDDLAALLKSHLSDKSAKATDLFKNIAQKLMNSYKLVVADKSEYRIAEIEFYLRNETGHKDTFTHCDPI